MTTYPDRLMPGNLAATSFQPHHSESSFSQSWFAIQTRYRFEAKIASQLGRKGIEAFLPLMNETHRWSDRRKTISLPLFSGYVFVRPHPNPASRMQVLRTAGVIGFVSAHGNAVPIPTRQIEDLRRLLEQKVPCALHAFLKVGQRVRIRGGCLEGLEGILAESNQKQIVISIAGIERSLAIGIAGYELELA